MSTTLILDRVQSITKRPDARPQGLIALNTIIKEICTRQNWPQDLVEVSLPNPTPDQAAAIIPMPLDVRAVEYITAGDRPLQPISPRNALSPEGCAWVNTYYRSGNSWIVRAALGFPILRVGYYVRVPVLDEGPGNNMHWLMNESEQLLITGTLARVFSAIGDDTSAAQYEALYQNLRKLDSADVAASL